ncbi:hypothetical protein IMCC3135_32415 [Granulosicoccus antarcticus IMCC3135]|uniref:Uncharacterized protein n=1 Tax=Granulosicoccus antarcticus IMCC3135 TaxID=1192854 RepID=A0A2Z2P2I5_9GAMM|nr:hypothetical protein IMCC3135_32415 [Granulosicoccus antarcticus IMCC3135]
MRAESVDAQVASLSASQMSEVLSLSATMSQLEKRGPPDIYRFAGKSAT